jgi:hypothetical protein
MGEHLAACQLRLLEWAKGKGAVEIFCPLVPKRGLEGGNKSVKLPVAESRRSRVEKPTSTQCVLHVFFQRMLGDGRQVMRNTPPCQVLRSTGAISLTLWEVVAPFGRSPCRKSSESQPRGRQWEHVRYSPGSPESCSSVTNI